MTLLVDVAELSIRKTVNVEILRQASETGGQGFTGESTVANRSGSKAAERSVSYVAEEY